MYRKLVACQNLDFFFCGEVCYERWGSVDPRWHKPGTWKVSLCSGVEVLDFIGAIGKRAFAVMDDFGNLVRVEAPEVW